jgi:broad specificity phosphatase PhoE
VAVGGGRPFGGGSVGRRSPGRRAAGGQHRAEGLADPGAGRPVDRDLRFAEIRRVEPWEGDYRRLRREYVEGVDHPDWEPRAEVAERFDAAVTEHLDIAGERPLVVASHGMAMTVWLTARIGLPDPGAFWSGLRFPDARRVDLTAGTINALTVAR